MQSSADTPTRSLRERTFALAILLSPGPENIYAYEHGRRTARRRRTATHTTKIEENCNDNTAPTPPFTHESAIKKVRAGENTWNTRDPQRVALAYTPDSWWRNRSTFVQGRDQIIEFLTAKWARELDYRLIKELWAYGDHRIAVRFAYEIQDASGQWFRAYGNENSDLGL